MIDRHYPKAIAFRLPGSGTEPKFDAGHHALSILFSNSVPDSGVINSV